MILKHLSEELSASTYPGRGIVVGRSEDGRYAVTAYFIMGRSANSRNRVFVEDGEGIRTQAFDPSKMEDPSLIIYAPVRVLGTNTIVTNGDQTDTIWQGLQEGKTFGESLRCREFEPDAPNYTPRISALLDTRNGEYEYRMSILKSADGDPSCCERFTYSYDNPNITGDIDFFTDLVWNNLNEDNKVSLCVRFIDIENGTYSTRIVNKNQ